MKLLQVPPLTLSCASSHAALAAVFSPDTLREVHGPGTHVGAFVGGRRTLCFDVDVSRVPRPIRCFFCGPRLRVTTAQTVTAAPAGLDVTNDITMHFVGSELFAVRPTFSLRDHDGRVTVSGRVQHHARLPWPLRGIAESFMAAHSERELLKFKRVLQRRGLVAPDS